MARKSYYNYFAPTFFLRIGGKPANDLKKYIVRYEYADNTGKKADTLTLTINNKGLRFNDDPRFHKGVRIQTRFGYPHNMSDMYELVVSKVRASADDSGQPVIVITAKDVRKEATKDGKAKNWGPVASSDIVREIARRWGLNRKELGTRAKQEELAKRVSSTVVDHGGVAKSIEDSNDARKESKIQPASMSDIQFVMHLAEKLNWDAYFKGGNLFFHPPKLNKAPKLSYVYYTDGSGTLASFEVSIDYDKKGKTGKTGADDKTGKTNSASSDNKSSSKSHTGDHLLDIDTDRGALYARGRSDRHELSGPSAETDPRVMKKQADAKQQKNALSAITAEIRVVGEPKLLSRDIVRLQGVGRAYSGNWRVKESKHTINATGQIYVTSAKLERNALNLGDKKDKVSSGNNKKATDATRNPNTLVIYTDTGALVGL